MSDEKKQVSKVPPPIIPLSGSSSPPLIWHKPDWNFWKHKTKIKLWEAAFLCCDIDSRNQDYRDIKGRHYEKVAIYLDLLKDNLNRLDFDFVNLPEVAEWALSKDLDIPKELAALAKKPDEAIAPSEKNANESTTKEAPMRFDKKRAFLLDYLNKEKPPNFASVWQYIQDNAGKEKFLFRSAGRSTATMTDEEIVEKKNLSRQFGKLLEKIKERENL